MSEATTCPNCSTQYKNSIFGNIQPLKKTETEVINLYSGKPPALYCTKCGNNELQTSRSKLGAEMTSLANKLNQLISYIPVITVDLPLNWNYSIVGMVTGQSTTGTGVISEFTSSFTDLFGAQSNRYNSKLKNGENLCLQQLRAQAIDMHANAVIGADVDYSEVGGDKGMLMVCMSGTAVVLKNTDVLPNGVGEKIEEARKCNERMAYLNALDKKLD